MGIEGLRVVLEKEAVVGTPTADQLVQSPESVEANFMRHVRSYVPFGRASGVNDDQLSVTQFEKRLITAVREARAPKGYITADFGYGKTSTALYLWHRCREANLLAVPPFRMSKLDDLILATYGWSRYEIGRRTPALVDRVESIYRAYSERSIESDAGEDQNVAERLRDLMRQGRYTLTLTPIDYLRYFEEMSTLACEAGFEGLVILPDEVQQYVEPTIRAGLRDPIAPLFDIVQAFITRKGQLRVGIIFSIPSKELGVINDQRADLVQRLKMDGLGLDLRTIYDEGFAKRLWQQLAKEFEFMDDAAGIVTDETLDSLGQIAGRDDLANGPRTVIATFTHMAQRYTDTHGKSGALTPLGLVDAFLGGKIVFDGTSKLQQIVNQHLDSRIVSERPAYRDVVKVLGAFPTRGATRAMLSDAKLLSDADEFIRLTQGDIAITVGGGRDDHGNELPYGTTLRGLEPASSVGSDWLTQTIREFSRGYVEQSDLVLHRAQRAFLGLLTAHVFREPDWKVTERLDERMNQSGGLVLEGSFRSTVHRFPARRIFIRVVREGETPSGEREADITFDFTLARYLDDDDQARRSIGGAITVTETRGNARFELNLFHRASELFYTDLQATLQPVVSPYRLTPLLLLSLHAYIEDKREQHLIPKEDDREIAQTFQPLLFEHALDELFNTELGKAYNATRERICEELFRRLCESRYPEYRTIVTQQSWRNTLRDYETALERLQSRYERQGETDVTDTKEVIARLFNRSNTAFDSFVATFPDLITVTKPFQRLESGGVRFTLHSLERAINDRLQRGEHQTVRQVGQAAMIRVLPLSEANMLAKDVGYLQAETDALLEIMAKRELIEIMPQKNEIRQVLAVEVRLEDVQRHANSQQDQVEALLAHFPDETFLQNQKQQLAASLQQIITNPIALDARTRQARISTMRAYERQVSTFVEQQMNRLRQTLREESERPVTNFAGFRLDTPITGEFFAAQLDAVRAALATKVDTLRMHQYALQDRALACLESLREEETVLGLCQGRDKLIGIQQQGKKNTDDAIVLETRARDLDQARRVLAGMIELDAHRKLSAGTLDSELARSLSALDTRIAGELSSRKEKALSNAPQWEEERARLRTTLTEMQRAQAEEFEERKSQYLSPLRTYLKLNKDLLSTKFNPLDPAGTLDALTNEVIQHLSRATEQALSQLDMWGAELRGIINSPDLADADDASGRLSATCRVLLEDIQETERTLRNLQRRAQNPDTIRDNTEESGRYHSLVRLLATSLEPLGRYLAGFKQIDAAIKPKRLEPAERDLFEVIRGRVKDRSDQVELGSLLHDTEYRATHDLATIWSTLERLYEKRRLRLFLAPSPRTIVNDGNE